MSLGVGRGKTYLTDLFSDTALMAEQTRIHPYRYMLSVHDGLKNFCEVRDPLVQVARQLVRQNRLLCLDEIAVLEIGETVILAGLLRLLMENGVTIVSFANIEPDKLYEGRVQRYRFLQAIVFINQRPMQRIHGTRLQTTARRYQVVSRSLDDTS